VAEAGARQGGPVGAPAAQSGHHATPSLAPLAERSLSVRSGWNIAAVGDCLVRAISLGGPPSLQSWGPELKSERSEGCPGCTFETDNLVGAVAHLAHRDVTFILASRSPLEVLNAYKARMGWEIEWVSSEDAFDRDFYEIMHVPTPRRPGNMLDVMELMALSVFALDDGVVYHTDSTYDRGTEALNATWQLLDRAPKGRGENFDGWPGKRDEYATA
jgi:predicted dithiol-disulfide oxidoreductase (DUF899 family)